MVPYRPWVIRHMSLTRITVNGKIQQRTCGGVGAPVGLTVFKTAGGSLGAVPGGFDSHTPLPGTTVCMLCDCLFTHGFAGSAKLCFPRFVHKNTFSYFEIFISHFNQKHTGGVLYPSPVTTSQLLMATAEQNQEDR